MDTSDLTLAGLVLLPVILLLVLRVNATIVFLSLCLGNVLVQFVANDTVDFLTLHHKFVPQKAASFGGDTIKLILLLLPVVLTTIFMIKTIRGNGRQLLNILPAAGVGLLGALLVVPLLPPGLSHNVVDSKLWWRVTDLKDAIVSASAFVCMLVLWLQRPKTGDKHSKKHKD
jgi:hypothetical protein